MDDVPNVTGKYDMFDQGDTVVVTGLGDRPGQYVWVVRDEWREFARALHPAICTETAPIGSLVRRGEEWGWLLPHGEASGCVYPTKARAVEELCNTLRDRSLD